MLPSVRRNVNVLIEVGPGAAIRGNTDVSITYTTPLDWS